MKWLIILVGAIDWSCNEIAHAEDFRLRVETVERGSDSEKDAKEVVLNTIEVVTRPGEKFQTRVILGAQTLVLRGKIEWSDDGGFNVQIRHLCEFDTGEFVTFAEGGKQPIVDRSSVSTTLKVIEGKAITLSKFVSAKSKPDECPIKSERRVVLMISKDEDNSKDRITN